MTESSGTVELAGTLAGGALMLTGGLLDDTGAGVISSAASLNGGTVAVAAGNVLTLSGAVTWNGGTVTGPGTLATTGTTTLGGATFVGDGLTWINSGLVQVNFYSIYDSDPAGSDPGFAIINQAGGTFDYTDGSASYPAFDETDNGTTTFTNAGLLETNAGTDTVDFDAARCIEYPARFWWRRAHWSWATVALWVAW